MSEKKKRIIGCLLLAASLAVCLLPAAFRQRKTDEKFTARNHAEKPELQPVEIIAGGEVNINLDDAEALCALNGVGPTLAERIIRERETNGQFWYPEDLTGVSGIGEKTLRKMETQLNMSVEGK